MRVEMKKEQIVGFLKEKFSYPEKNAIMVAEKIIDFQLEVSEAFQAYIESGELPELCYEGFDFEKLSNQYQMNPIAAFLTLDWLKREPEKAVDQLNKGFDQVSTK